MPSLGEHPLVGFVPCTDSARARAFYAETLGMALRNDDGFALVFGAGDRTLRVVPVGDFTAQPFTVLGWDVPDIAAAVAELSSKGVEFLRFPHFDQDAAGIWTAPSGDRVAWFHDPDGNVLSVSSHS
jgi:catechol 2,3-dioxygenase-like lactoylglutathione lyase family enzyme